MRGRPVRSAGEGHTMYALVAIGFALTVVMLLIFGPLAGAAATGVR